MTSFEIVITIAIVVAGTLLTRFSAFLIFPPGKKAPDFVQYLGKALPAAVMGMLVVYTFKDTIVLSYPYGVPELIALLVTVGMHVWKRNMFMSIGAGTVVYMILVQAVNKIKYTNINYNKIKSTKINHLYLFLKEDISGFVFMFYLSCNNLSRPSAVWWSSKKSC